jgi:pentatricopeptide repeat protein
MSYAGLVTMHAQAGKLDEVVKVYHESMLPAAKQHKGFLDARLFIDRATGKGISVVRWQSEEGR